jgi:hypothetical protein
MTPKEKANDLVNNMFNCDNSTPEKSMAMLLIHAKQCALIAVDEVIEALHEHHWQNRLIIDYWEEVKQEIEQL